MYRKATLRSVLRRKLVSSAQPERLKPVIAPATPCSTRPRSAQPRASFPHRQALMPHGARGRRPGGAPRSMPGHLSGDPASLAWSQLRRPSAEHAGTRFSAVHSSDLVGPLIVSSLALCTCRSCASSDSCQIPWSRERRSSRGCLLQYQRDRQ